MALKLRHVVVTGAAGGIGAALCRAFAAAPERPTLTLCDIDLVGCRALAESLGSRAHPLRWDLADEAARESTYAAIVGIGGPIDVLVNCAGIMEVRNLAGTPWPMARRLLEIDLIAPLWLMHRAANDMIARGGGGAVINISSLAGLVPLRGTGWYGAAKAGLAMASEVARLDLDPLGVQVMTVYPGPIATPLEARARQQWGGGLLARVMPTGTATAMADAIVRGLREGAPRLTWPPVYASVMRW
ncbi:MAG: SDR family oxidoreductase, partial [Myxococcales bacterium]|nr:SDR family oxidoreductase [Myxococcales bacterium]